MKAPKGWKISALDEVADVTGGIQKGPHRAPGANPVRYLTVAHVQRNRVIIDDPRYFEITEKELERWRLKPRDVLIIEGNGSASEIGRTALFRGEIRDCVHQNHVIRVRAHAPELSAEYLNAFLNSSVGQAALQAESFSSSGLRTLSVGRIRELQIPLPLLPEQQKIAAILGSWDEALEKLGALIAAKDRRKKALMQQLLTGKRWLKRFAPSKAWKHQPFDVVFERLERKASAEVERALSITAGVGFVDQREKFSRVIAGANLENYILLKRGEFSYNKGNSDRYPQGCVYRLEEFDEGAVPNVWISFRLRSDAHSSNFYKHFFLGGGHNHQLHRLINFGVRNDGLLNLTADSFFSIKIPVPEPEVQQALGEFFEHLDTELRLLRQQRAALDQQKRGLMQQLLTGQIRVKP